VLLAEPSTANLASPELAQIPESEPTGEVGPPKGYRRIALSLMARENHYDELVEGTHHFAAQPPFSMLATSLVQFRAPRSPTHPEGNQMKLVYLSRVLLLAAACAVGVAEEDDGTE